MKAYTDIEQSKKLAEILPIESADMYYEECCNLPEVRVGNYSLHLQCRATDKDYKKLTYLVLSPAWSLAALLELIQDDIKIEKTLFDQSDLFTYSILSDTFDYRTYEHEELIDACYEMVLKLHESKLL